MNAENLLGEDVLIPASDMCEECRDRKPGTQYIELPGVGSGMNVRTRDLPDASEACRVCGVRKRATAS